MIPQHVAIIMDGNGRWAQKRGYPRFYGHIKGCARVKEIVREASDQGVKALTLYAFSTENWKRPDEELNILWRLLGKYLKREVKELKKNGVRLNVIGEPERLPEHIKKELKESIHYLKDGTGLQLTFALSYGGRAEILSAVQKIALLSKQGEIEPEQISEQFFREQLWTGFLGECNDVDYMIRTSGEKRLSNYLLWQCSYAEFDFPETLWPDFTALQFRKSLEEFKTRKRRFGNI